MERMKKNAAWKSGIVAVLLMGMTGIGAMGAADPATQPSGAPPANAGAANAPASAAGAAPVANDSQPSRRDRRGNRGTHGDTSGSSIAASATPSDQFAVLQRRSIFVKGNQAIAGGNTGRGATVVRTSEFGGRPSSTLVFNGVIAVDDEFNAMIEDTSTNKVALVRVGDAIAAGRVSDITFDDMTYEANGRAQHVQLGENMDGVAPTFAVAPPSPPTSQPAPAGTPGPAPADVGSGGAVPTPAPAPATGADDIIAKLKAKRAKELGGSGAGN